jgi:phenylpropionate dioxygenase-like ring-hydroxylating dioxygenase large terminal subunit
MRNHLGGSTFGFQLDWYRPNLSCLHFGASDYAKLHVVSIPVNAAQTRVMVIRRIRTGGRAAPAWRTAEGASHPVLDEDRAVVESQRGAVTLDDSEVSVATDGPSVVFRRWYKNLLRQEAR